MRPARARPLRASRARTPTLRLEWEGVDDVPKFSGKGAGHPHWHFGSEIAEAESAMAENHALAERYDAELSVDTVDEDRLLLGVDAPLPDVGAVQVTTASARPSLTRFHLPAKAGWAAEQWNEVDDPQGTLCHASNPTDSEQLVRWAVSAAKYVKNEMEKYG